MTLSIVLIYPELLGTYGDKGNALVLAHRARARNIDTNIVSVSPGDVLPVSGDIYLCGGGEDNAQKLATDLLREQKKTLDTIASRSQIVAVCAGFQILGKQFPVSGGALYEGLDIIDVTTRPGTPRIIGEILVDTHNDQLGVLTGFENHSGRTILGTSTSALGEVTRGIGNGVDNNGFIDGYFSHNIIGTYLHGPLFARNPRLCDYLIAQVTNTPMGNLAKIMHDPAETLHQERITASIR